MLKDETIHFTLSLIVGTIVGYIFGNYWAIPMALLGGFFIDADHLIDYLIYTKLRRFDLSEFFDHGKFFDRLGKIYVFFHGFEFAVVLIILAIIFSKFSWLFYSLGFSYLIHLFYDTIFNGAVWPTYFLSFRIYHRFDLKVFKFPKNTK